MFDKLRSIFFGGKKVRVGDEVFTKAEWKRRLASNEGLFERIKVKPQYAGPHLEAMKTGEEVEPIIQGDQLWVERNVFNEYANQFQHHFYDELEKIEPEWANEYLLNVINAIDKWKDDIKVLNGFISMLREEEHVFEDEEYKVKVVEELKKRLPDVIEKHLPTYFQTIKEHLTDMDRFINDLRNAEEKMKQLEAFIQDYFRRLKTSLHMGFLFE